MPFSNKSITYCEVMLTPKYVRKCWTTSGSLWSTGSVPSCSVPSSDPIGREAAEPTGSVPSCSACAVQRSHRSRSRGAFGHLSNRLGVYVLLHRLLSWCLVKPILVLEWCWPKLRQVEIPLLNCIGHGLADVHRWFESITQTWRIHECIHRHRHRQRLLLSCIHMCSFAPRVSASRSRRRWFSNLWVCHDRGWLGPECSTASAGS